MVVEITQIGIETLHWKFYVIWTVLNGSFVPFTYYFYPETAGRTLEDIDAYFRGQPSLLVFRDKVSGSKQEVTHESTLTFIDRNILQTPDCLHRKGRTRSAPS